MNWQSVLDGHLQTFRQLAALEQEATEAAEAVIHCLKQHKTVFIAGNGGSAADAQHFAAELTGRFVKERRGLPGIALTTDTSALTAIANDYGYEKVFSRQLESLGQSGDLFVGISTSGHSPNILAALETARSLGMKTLGLTGRDGGKMPELCDYCLIVPSRVTAHIQEAHIFLIHYLCAETDPHFS